MLTIEYMQTEKENKYFDRKSAKIRPSDLARHISAFANADGGTLVIGIADNGDLEGINSFGEKKINEFISSPKDCCKPMPVYDEEFIDVVNLKGKADRILLLHIYSDPNQIVRTSNDETYLRIGDKSREMLGENLRNLEYAKSTRRYEDELNPDATIDDLDVEILERYRKHIDADDIDMVRMLRARGFIKERNGKEYLTNAAVLLFAENIQQFYPNSRIRFIRYDGTYAGVGTKINITKDYSIDLPILRIIDEAKKFISSQLREFTALNKSTGKFTVVPEYPEFAWLEGIVNAVTHREYAMSGSYIKVSMYDDRLEIESPGKLPNLVTVDNIQDTRYSRNPKISRVLTEFGWVRELNEGVKRIYSDMKAFFLDEPVYSETDASVRLTLKNNIVMRAQRQENRAFENIGADKWAVLDDLEKTILTIMVSRGAVGRASLESETEKSSRTITKRINHLMELNLIKANGNVYDPKRTYEILK